MKTDLGVFLKQYRIDNGLTQAGLQEQLEGKGATVSSGYISKLESGVIKLPDDVFLAKLAELTGTDVVSLRNMCRETSEVSSKLRMACGHSVWSAPLYLAACDGLVPNLQISTFIQGEPRVDLRAEHLDWIVPFSERMYWADRPELTPLSAADVALLLDRGQVDVGSLPGNLVRTGPYKDSLLCVGTIVDSASGCCLVCPPDIAKEWMSTNDLGQLLAEKTKGHGRKNTRSPVRFGAEEGTIAFQYLSQACAHGAVAQHQVVWNCKAAELRRRSFRELADVCKQEEKATLMGIVAWEPHATWLVRNSKADNGAVLEKCALQFAPHVELGKESHLTYEIVITRRRLGDPLPRKRELFQTLNQLVTVVAQTASRLNNLGTVPESVPESVMRRLADFLGFFGKDDDEQAVTDVIEETQRIINRILYSVRWHVLPEMGIGPQA